MIEYVFALGPEWHLKIKWVKINLDFYILFIVTYHALVQAFANHAKSIWWCFFFVFHNNAYICYNQFITRHRNRGSSVCHKYTRCRVVDIGYHSGRCFFDNFRVRHDLLFPLIQHTARKNININTLEEKSLKLNFVIHTLCQPKVVCHTLFCSTRKLADCESCHGSSRQVFLRQH